jgi:putative ABC transport system substrate-binding protein
MAGGGDPVGARLVQSLARPGGNVTGVSLLAQELMEKHVELLKQMLPALSRLTQIQAAGNPANSFFAQQMGAAAKKVGVQLVILEIRGPDDLEAAFGRITSDAAFMLADPMFFAHRHRIARLAIRRRLPLVSGQPTFAEAGFLMNYNAAGAEVLRLTAVFVDKILRGAKPADLPVEQPSRLELVVNLATAKTLGLSIPREISLRADQVID